MVAVWCGWWREKEAGGVAVVVESQRLGCGRICQLWGESLFYFIFLNIGRRVYGFRNSAKLPSNPVSSSSRRPFVLFRRLPHITHGDRTVVCATNDTSRQAASQTACRCGGFAVCIYEMDPEKLAPCVFCPLPCLTGTRRLRRFR